MKSGQLVVYHEIVRITDLQRLHDDPEVFGRVNIILFEIRESVSSVMGNE